MLDFIKYILPKAGEIFHSTKTEIIGQKAGGGNWVTKKDIAIEKFIIKQIKSKYPAHSILSEENEQTIESLDKDNLWILDPLDGTTNAFYGLPHYAVSLAFLKQGEVKIGAIYNIPSKTIYWAKKGEGAFIQDKSQKSPLKIAVKDDGLRNTLVCTGSPYTRENFIPTFKLMDKVHKAGARLIILGSVVVASSYVAEGKLSLYFEKGLKPWDIAAASLIIEEAGGNARNLEGKLDIFDPKTFVCGGKKTVKEFMKLANA